MKLISNPSPTPTPNDCTHTTAPPGLYSFAQNLIRQMKTSGKITTAEHYASALRSFLLYYGSPEIDFESIDRHVICGYEDFLKNKNLCPNTTSFYMRTLRAIYNQAVRREFAPLRNPFMYVYTGVAGTLKRALPLSVLRRLYGLDLSLEPRMELARNLFIFSFCTRGMAFVDMAFLKKSDIKDGILIYRRRKTSQLLSIRWEKPMRDIAVKYSGGHSTYLFPLIKDNGADPRRQYLNAYKVLSRRLRRLGSQIGLGEALTYHRARHTWASLARRNNVPLTLIKEGMGHNCERTTQIYLDSIESPEVDKANRRLISLLSK